MESQPFFTRDAAGRYVPTAVARGPWDPKSLHGRVIAGLLGFVIERDHGGLDYMPARLTVDMYKLPDLSPIEVSTRVVREGYRIKVIDAEFVSAGVSMARATCQLLRRTENPDGNVWSPPNWDAPAPADIPPPEDKRSGIGGMWEVRPISGAMGTLGQRRLWMREVRDLVEGCPLTPFVRVAVGADFASPFANAGDKGLAYINSDVTVYLHRLPKTEWIGYETVNHQATDGVAIGECFLYDETGPIGSATVAALVQKRTPPLA
jgi:hypothetical protein